MYIKKRSKLQAQRLFKESLMDALHGCEAVVHLAAIRPLKGQESDYLIYNKNVELTSNIFESCRNVGISNIVFASSISIYNPRCNNIPFKTSDKIEYTLNLYGLSKYFCEKLALYYNHYYGMDIKSLRLAQVLGVGEKEGGYGYRVYQKSNEQGTFDSLW